MTSQVSCIRYGLRNFQEGLGWLDLLGDTTRNLSCRFASGDLNLPASSETLRHSRVPKCSASGRTTFYMIFGRQIRLPSPYRGVGALPALCRGICGCCSATPDPCHIASLLPETPHHTLLDVFSSHSLADLRPSRESNATSMRWPPELRGYTDMVCNSVSRGSHCSIAPILIA